MKKLLLSIKNLESAQLPDFTLLIGRNGIGKTQLLEAIQRGHVAVSNFLSSDIKMYNLSSFRPQDSDRAGWGNCYFAESTVEKYFTSDTRVDIPLVEVAENIFKKVTNDFDLTDGSADRRQFEYQLRNKISSLTGYGGFPMIKTSEAAQVYCREIQRDIIGNIQSNRNNRGNTPGNSPFMLLILTMKLTGKLPHEICREDVLQAANYEGEPIANDISHVFTRYKVEQFSWAHREGDLREESIKSLMSRYREENPPPWIVLRKYLDQMRGAAGDTELFNFEFSDPEEDQISFTNHSMYSFGTKLTNRATGDSYSTKSLSSGEKILMSLCLASFNQDIGRQQPKLVLLDELDTVLHPSMVTALISSLKTLFVEKGTPVIMATHSVTTAAMVEEGEIYRVVRSNNKIELKPATKSKAVSELSEGIATIDTGLKIASSTTAPITILTEGGNALHLKKWADLFYPEKVGVFEGLSDKTGKDQLKTYGQFLAKVDTNSHFLIVWDCDAEAVARRLRESLGDVGHVTAFSFEKRNNEIAEKGIENKYDEEYLKPFANRTTEFSTGKEICLSLSSDKKREFAEFIFSNGTKEHFQHFDDLRRVVDNILSKLPN